MSMIYYLGPLELTKRHSSSGPKNLLAKEIKHPKNLGTKGIEHETLVVQKTFAN